MAPPKPKPEWLWWVPKCWPGETVVVLGGGKSLTDQQIDYVRRRHEAGACRVVAINRNYLRAPWADWLYGADAGRFWAWCGGPIATPTTPGRIYPTEPDALEFAGEKLSLWSYATNFPTVHFEWIPQFVAAGGKLLQHPGDGWHTGMSNDPGWVRGNNSCYNLLSGPIPYSGAARSILLGIDMRDHGWWHLPWPGQADSRGEPLHLFEAEQDPPVEGQGPTRQHRGAIMLDGREVEIGWYKSAEEARLREREFSDHIRWDCPQPALHLHGVIAPFATLLRPLAQIGHEVANCSPGSALRVFPMARLENVL